MVDCGYHSLVTVDETATMKNVIVALAVLVGFASPAPAEALESAAPAMRPGFVTL